LDSTHTAPRFEPSRRCTDPIENSGSF